jgi:hypothetical protein
MFCFRATKSFHVNGRQVADRRVVVGPLAPWSITHPLAFTALR